MKRFSFKRRSIVITWLFSYMLILFIPIIISGLMYLQTKSAFESEITKSNKYMLNIFKQNMDFILTDVQKLSLEIATESNVQYILNMKGNSETEDNYSIIKAAESLRNFNAINRNAENVFIYLKSKELIINSAFSTDTETFAELYGRQIGLGKDELQNCFNGSGKGVFTSLPVKTGGGLDKRKIIYSISLPVFENGDHSACLIISMDNSVFFEGANSVLSREKSEILILDDSSEIIAAMGNSIQANADSFKDLLEEDRLSYYKSGTESYAVSSTNSDVIRWKYVLSVPARVLMEKAEYIRNLTAIGLVLCLFIGGIITYYSLVKSYNPLKAMINSLEDRLKYSFDKGFNEYSFIQQAINKVSDENAKINYRLSQQSKTFRNGVIASLLKGKEPEVPVHELISNYDISFDSDRFLVIVFYIEEIDPSVFKDMDSFALDKLVQFIFTNVVEELVGQVNRGYFTDVDDLFVCLVNLKEEETGSWKSEMMRVIKEAEDFINTHYKIQFSAAVSNIHTTISGIPQAYYEAFKTMEFKRVIGTNDIYFYDEINDIKKTEYYFPMEKEYQLINCIKSGDLENSRKLLNGVFLINFEHGMQSVEIARCLMFDLASTMIKTINEIGSIYQNDFIERMDLFKTLIECKSINQMKGTISEILEEVCRYIVSARKNPETKIKDRVIEFVEKNYSDMNLSISTIADHIGLTPAYVSKLFKEQMSEGILDYINEVRVGKVKELMKISDDNIENIARSVGYSNAKTFTRAFKKHEGTTPGRFKG